MNVTRAVGLKGIIHVKRFSGFAAIGVAAPTSNHVDSNGCLPSAASPQSVRPAFEVDTASPWYRAAGKTWLALCLLISTFFAYRALPDNTWALKPAVASSIAPAQPAYRTRSIEKLVKGDKVLAQDPETGKLERNRIKQTFERISDHLRILKFVTRTGRQQTLETTDEHPFWSPDRQTFVSAKSLNIGDRVIGPAGELQWIQSTIRHEKPEGVTVYNFEVEDFHTYFVSQLGATAPPVLVHNANSQGNCADDANAPTGAASRFTQTTTPWQRQAYQRADIDWDFVRPQGTALAGQTNRAAARQGYTPVRVNPQTGRVDDLVLHHALDDPRGAVIETWRSSHTRFHQTIGREPNPWRLKNPEWAQAWQREQSAYWRWRTGAYNPTPTDRLRLPGDP